jgi:flagellin
MSLVINTNSAATVAAANLASSSALLARSLNRLSSGSKIVNPADDAGGLAVAMKLNAAVKRQGGLASNLGNTTSFLQTQDGVLKAVGKVLERIGELKTLNTDPTKNATDRSNYDTEFQALKLQIGALASEKFNGVALFGSAAMSVQTSDDTASILTIQGVELLAGSPGAPVTINFNTNSTTTAFSPSGPGTLTASATDPIIFTGGGGWGNVIGQIAPGSSATYDGVGGWTGLSSGAVSGTTVQIDDDNAGGTATFTPAGTATGTGLVAAAADLDALALSSVTDALQEVATHRATNGARQSRLAYATELLAVNRANLEAAVSRINDVDVAEESTRLARHNTLVQAGTAMLSQANQSPQAVLRLLG